MALHALIEVPDLSGYTPSACRPEPLSALPSCYRKSKTFLNGSLGLKLNGFYQTFSTRKLQTPHAPSLWQLSFEDIAEIEESLGYFQNLSLPRSAINTSSFPLTSRFRLKMKRVLAVVYGTSQYMILRGLDSSRYSNTENVIIHAGISSHIGSQRALTGYEGGDKTAVHHIIAIDPCRSGSRDQYHAPPNQARDIPFHTDDGDIVSLYAVSTSESGGTFYLADSSAVYNDLAVLEPRLAEVLTDDWIIPSPSNPKDFDKRPIFFPNHPSGRALVNCSRSRITGTPSAPRDPSFPPLTQTQQQAIDKVHHLAAKHAVGIRLQPGDMIFWNNLSMLHARDAFIDNEAVGKKRHLLRLILRNEEMAYELPDQLKNTWKRLYEHDVREELLPVDSELFSRACTH